MAAVLAPEPPWVVLKDEELLQWRICDLRVRIEGSELEPSIADLRRELEQRGLAVRPDCYLGDEWFSPEGSCAIAIPFYLAHPRLKALEHRQMMEVEGGTPEWRQMLLRHEAGHAIDHAYAFSSRSDWRRVFGSPEEEYAPEFYRPRPYSRSFVHHLANFYAQAHPDEDFAETFAVWLVMPAEEWRSRYRGWKALAKLEYMDALMKEVAGHPAAGKRVRRISEARRLRKTLARYYAERRKLWADDFPDVYDADLRDIFGDTGAGSQTAAQFIKQYRKELVSSIVQWTGQPKYTVDTLVERLIRRCQHLRLTASDGQPGVAFDLAAYLSALVSNYLHTGRFKRTT